MGRAVASYRTAVSLRQPAPDAEIFRQLITVKAAWRAFLQARVNDAPALRNESHPWEAFEIPAGQHPDEREIFQKVSPSVDLPGAGRRAKKKTMAKGRSVFSGMA